jgi:hypothetical protein
LPIGRPGQPSNTEQAFGPTNRLTAGGGDHIYFSKGTDIPVIPPAGDKGDSRAVRRPDRVDVIPIPVGELASGTTHYIGDEKMVVTIAPPAEGIVPITDALHYANSWDGTEAQTSPYLLLARGQNQEVWVNVSAKHYVLGVW